MPDVFSPRKRSEVMSRIRSKDTTPEIRIRSALHRLGFRFRLHNPKLPGKPDMVLPRYRTAIQVRGCFWHGHNCMDGHIPHSRKDYWVPKLEANRRRDARNDRKLRKLGWKVVVVWECRCTTKDGLQRELRRIEKVLKK